NSCFGVIFYGPGSIICLLNYFAISFLVKVYPVSDCGPLKIISKFTPSHKKSLVPVRDPAYVTGRCLVEQYVDGLALQYPDKFLSGHSRILLKSFVNGHL